MPAMNEWMKKLTSFPSLKFFVVDCVSVGCERHFHQNEKLHHSLSYTPTFWARESMIFSFPLKIAGKCIFHALLLTIFLSQWLSCTIKFQCAFSNSCFVCRVYQRKEEKKYQKGLRHAAHFSIHLLLVAFGREKDISRFLWIIFG